MGGVPPVVRIPCCWPHISHPAAGRGGTCMSATAQLRTVSGLLARNPAATIAGGMAGARSSAPAGSERHLARMMTVYQA